VKFIIIFKVRNKENNEEHNFDESKFVFAKEGKDEEYLTALFWLESILVTFVVAKVCIDKFFCMCLSNKFLP